MQATELRRYAEANGWVVAEYAEKESSVKRRPVFEQLMKDATARKVDVILCWKLDRFARSLKQLMDNIVLLDCAGVRFICTTQAIDTDKRSPAARMMMHIFGAFAEFERSLIIERVRAGMSEAMRRGKHCGRPSPIWDREKARRLRQSGMSWRAIAAAVGQDVCAVRRVCQKGS